MKYMALALLLLAAPALGATRTDTTVTHSTTANPIAPATTLCPA